MEEYLVIIMEYFSPVLHKKICCGFHEHPHFFYGEIRKMIPELSPNTIPY